MEIKKKFILDTRWDTKTRIVSAKHYFALRNYIDRENKSPIYLVFTDGKKKIRINTDIKINPADWDNVKKRIKNSKNSDNYINYNLILDNFESKIISIKTKFHLDERMLSVENLHEQFQSDTPEFDFISFYKHHLKLQNYKKQSVKNHNSVINKLSKFKKEIPFHEITSEFFLKYRKFYREVNSEVTYNSDLKCIKTFLNLAVEQGIRLNVDLKKLKVNVESRSTVYLVPDEVKRLIKYYFSEFINPSHILPLGYFLFSCYTGLRVSDVLKRSRGEILNDFFQFSSQKNDRFQGMRLNNDARAIVMHRPELFEKSLVEQKINFHLKAIAKMCSIDKNLTMHVGRHTFATAFYRNTKDIIRLQKLLGHANIRHTMHYVHLVDSEANNDLDFVTF